MIKSSGFVGVSVLLLVLSGVLAGPWAAGTALAMTAAESDAEDAADPDMDVPVDDTDDDGVADPGVKKRAEMAITPEPEKSPEDETVDRIKNPTPWFHWGADQRLREVYIKNPITLDKGSGDDYHFQRFRTRLWTKLTPLKDLEFKARLVWEFRNWCDPKSRNEFEGDEALFDELYVKWKNIAGTPLTATVGRQTIALGDRWLVFDGTPLDGSRTIYFDAVRLSYELKDIQTTIDGFYIEQRAEPDDTIKPFNNKDAPITEQNEKGALLWVSNKSFENTEINGYFFYKHDDKDSASSNSNEGDVYTFGGRIAGDLCEHWMYRSELAYQFGHTNSERLSAFGANNRIAYRFLDDWKTRVRMHYEYLSGDDPDTDTVEAFDPLWGRWPQWSELYVYTYAMETRIGQVTNLHRVAWGLHSYPGENWEVCADYHLLFADENTVQNNPRISTSNCFRGQLLTGVARYKFTRYISGHLLAEFFFPGDYYQDTDGSRADTALMFRYELTFSF
jgi:hypothetical protein